MDILNEPGIAILIDCWDDDTDAHTHIYENIVEKINILNIQTVVLATYQFNFCEHFKTEWVDNSNHIFYNGAKSLDAAEQWRKDFFNESSLSLQSAWHTENTKLVVDSGRKTHDIILNQKNNKKKFMLHDCQSFYWYINCLVPHIKNFWYFGQAWEMCIRDRSLGYKTLSKIFPEKNHLTSTDCVLKLNYTNPLDEDMIGWDSLNKTCYKLI